MCSAVSIVLRTQKGVYNGLLAFGILMGVWLDDAVLMMTFAAGVAGMGIFGALSAKFAILFIQGAPALAASVLLHLSRSAAAAGGDAKSRASASLDDKSVWVAVFGWAVCTVLGAIVGARERSIEAANKAAGASASSGGGKKAE